MDKVKAAVQGADIKVKIGAAAVLVLLIALITWLVWPLSCASSPDASEVSAAVREASVVAVSCERLARSRSLASASRSSASSGRARLVAAIGPKTTLRRTLTDIVVRTRPRPTHSHTNTHKHAWSGICRRQDSASYGKGLGYHAFDNHPKVSGWLRSTCGSM